MKTLRFKMNINCGDYVSKVTPFLDVNEHILAVTTKPDN